MAQFAVTYIFVVEVDAENDQSVTDAIEEYVHSVSDPFSDPVTIEELEA